MSIFKVSFVSCLFARLLLSAHTSYGKGKYLNQTGFFYKIIVNFEGVPIELNSHKFSFVRYVFVEIYGLFRGPQGPQNDPKMTPKMRNSQKFPIFTL